MPAMRVCATVNAACIGIALAVASFAACAGSSTTSPPSGGGTNAPGTSEPGSSQAQSGQTDTPATGEPAAEPAKPAKAPESVADCKQMLTEITNDPPAGSVVMNNATPDADAGSTRFQPMVDLIKEKRQSFRCCFDIWAKNHPGVNGRVLFNFELKPDGTLIKAEIDQVDSTITVPEVESCMVEVAKAMTYPKSPTGKQTIYRHPFDFKARR
jgi:hypothetical protein